MATEEQLKVTIATVADLSGARQAQQALRNVTVGAEGANRALQQAMRAAPQTMAGFRAQVSAVEAQLGRRPTLGPEAFGITAEATREVVAHSEATKAVGESAHFTGGEIVRLGAAFAGLGIGLSAFTLAGRLAHDELVQIVSTTIALDQATRANTITLGNQAAAFQSWATMYSQQAGVTRQSLLEAGTTGAVFGRQAGLGPEQLTGLTQLAAQFGVLRGQNPAEVMTLLTEAMRGNAQAAQALNLNLDATHVAFTQLGQSTTEVFNQLDPGTQAWLRYQDAVAQAKDQTAGASGPVQDLNKAQSELNTSMERFGSSVGPPVVTLLAGVAKFAADAADAIQHFNEITVERNRQAGGDEGFKNEAAALDALGQKINEILPDIGKPIQDAREQLADLGKPIQDVGDALNQVFPDIGQPIQDAATSLGNAIDGVKDAAQSAGEAITQSFTDADNALKQAKDDADQAAANAVSAAQAIIAQHQAVLAAARQNVEAQLTEQTRLQHEAVNLSAEEARIRLRMLPTMEHIAALQRDMTEQQLRARLAGLPASQALENAQAAEQHAQLIIQDFSQPIERRSQAYRDIINLRLRTMPGLALAANEANEPSRLAGQAAARLGIEANLQDIAQQRALQGIQGAELQNQLVSAIVAANLQAAQQYQQQVQIPLQINIIDDQGRVVKVYDELIEANGQAKQPPATQVSAVRRN